MSHLMLSGAGPSNGGSFGPDQISGLKLWIKADADVYSDTGLTTPATNGGAVAGWKDQSSFTLHVTEGTGARQPIYRTDIASLPVIEWDASNDDLFRSSSAGLPTGTGQRTVFQVLRRLTAVTGFACFWKAGGSDHFGFNVTAGNAYRVYLENYYDSGQTIIVDGLFHILTADYDGTNLHTWKDSTSGNTHVVTPAASGSSGSLCIGALGAGSLPISAYIAEMIVYDTALSAANRQLVWTYLQTRWSTP